MDLTKTRTTGNRAEWYRESKTFSPLDIAKDIFHGRFYSITEEGDARVRRR